MPAVRRLLVVLVLLGGCGGGSKASDGGGGSGGGGGSASGGSGGGGDAASASCDADSMITVAGALTGTRTAPAAASSWSTSSGNGTAQVDAQFGTPFLAGWSFIFTGQPQATSYTDATAGVSCVITAAPTSEAGGTTEVWEANKGVTGTADQGTCSLTLTSVTPTLMLTSQTQYCVHGTVQATLPPKPSGTATGTVTFTASF
jgi:hypothetical protein